MTEIPTFCRICEPSCGLVATVENGELTALKPDKAHPVTKGFACHKGLAMLDVHKDPDRLNHPTRRVDGKDTHLTWDEAAAEIAGRLSAIRDEFGDEAIGAYTGNPLAFNSLAGEGIGSYMIANRIQRRFSSGTQDCSNKFAAGEGVFGSSTIHPIPDLDNTDFLLAFGANPRISHMSFVSIADPMKALRDARDRGARICFVDPRENESVKGIGELVQVHPDTDVYLMAALLNHLHATNQFDMPYLAERAENVDGLIEFVARYTPDAVADVVGIPADQIRQLADDFAAAPRAAVYMSTGVNMGRQGTLAYWLMFMLSMVTGNFDRPGGNVYSLGFYKAAKAGRVRQDAKYVATEFGEVRSDRGTLPGNLLADMILDAENPIRALIVVSGNPLLSIGGGPRLREAFAQLDLVVVIDIYDNATGHYADYLLPATDMFERQDINHCGLGLQAQPFVQFSDFIVPPKADRRPEWWIMHKLLQAQGHESIFDEGEVAYEEAFEAYGLWQRFGHMMKHADVTLDEVREAPSQTLVLPKPEAGRFFSDWVQTETGLIDCYPARFAEAVDRCHEIFAETGATPQGLKLISRRTNYMINSWFHNVARLKRAEHLTNPLYMHPDDARARNLGDGSTVRVFNDFGNVETVVALDEGLKPGTVAMTHGWGNQDTRMEVAKSHPGVNANDLLPSGPGSFEKISSMAFMTGIPVDVDVA